MDVMPEAEGSVLLDSTVSRVKGPLRVVLVDDREDVREATQAVLERLGAEVTAIDSPLRIRPVLAEVEPHLVISDVYMPQMDGIELIGDLKASGQQPDLIFMTGADPFYARAACRIAQAKGFRVRGYLIKPTRLAQFAEFLRLYEIEQE